MAQSITQSLQRRLHNIHRSQDVDGLRRLRITNRPDKLLHISTWIPSLSYATHSTINYSTEYVAEFLRLLNTFNIHTRIKCSFTGLETLAFTIGSHGYMDELYEYILRNKRDKNIEDVITEAEILYDKLLIGVRHYWYSYKRICDIYYWETGWRINSGNAPTGRVVDAELSGDYDSFKKLRYVLKLRRI